MQIVSAIVSLVLTAYIVWEVARFAPRYRQLKQAVADGDPKARTHIYKEALIFEWASALLALIALRFDWSKLNPAFLNLGNIRLIQPLLHDNGIKTFGLTGMLIGIVGGTVGFIVVNLKAKRKVTAPVSPGPVSKWRKLLPDFFALLPVTMRERMIWVAVAASAGVCEEIVFRGWLLATLHSLVGLNGAWLLITAAVLFGMAHSYQGITGVVGTGFAGVLFCALYVATGSLLIPMLLHIVVDVRFALMPAPASARPQEAYSH